MTGEGLLLIAIPLAFGMLITAILGRRAPIYAIHLGKGDRLARAILLIAPIFLYGFFLVALRPLDAGNDTPRYINTFNIIDGIHGSFEAGSRNYGNTELLWWPLQAILKYFLNARGWLAANYIAVFCFTAFYYRKAARQIGVGTEVFAFVFLSFFLVYTGNIMRQALAAPIGALGFYLFLQHRRSTALLMVFLAIGLHWSSIVFLTAPLFHSRIFDRNAVYSLIPAMALACSVFSTPVIGNAVSLLGMSEFSDKYNLYFESPRIS